MLTSQGACETRRVIFRVSDLTSLSLLQSFSFPSCSSFCVSLALSSVKRREARNGHQNSEKPHWQTFSLSGRYLGSPSERGWGSLGMKDSPCLAEAGSSLTGQG